MIMGSGGVKSDGFAGRGGATTQATDCTDSTFDDNFEAVVTSYSPPRCDILNFVWIMYSPVLRTCSVISDNVTGYCMELICAVVCCVFKVWLLICA